MFFKKIELHNFGIYKGTHEMNLSNKIDGRNITLVGGLNGRGKTTFHDAVLLALYGKQSMKYVQETAKSYEKLLKDHINKDAEDNLTYIAVTLVLDDDTNLRVIRSWQQKTTRLEQNLVVEKDGVIDKYLGENWNYYVEEILPFGIARFFFFNNEKITQLANDTSFEQIKSSIKSAIGVSTIDSAIAHVETVIGQKKSALEAFETSELNQDYKTVENDIFDISERLKVAREERDTLELECQNCAARLEIEESNFWASGGNLSKNREKIKEDMAKIREEVDRLQREIVLLTSEASTPLLICDNLVKQTYDKVKEHQIESAQRYASSEITKIFEKLISRLDQSDLEPGTLRKVKEIIQDEIQIKCHSEAEIDGSKINLTPSSLLLYDTLISDVFKNIRIKISELLTQAEIQETEYMNLDAHLGATDEKSLAMQLFEKLKVIEEEKAIADEKYRKNIELIESLERQREQLMAKRVQLIKGILEKENTNDDDTRIIKYAALSTEVLREFKIRLQREKIAKLSETVTACFKKLVEKESLAEYIDINVETLDVKIMSADGSELLKSQLSAGEQQMFAISIVWGLALTSGYKAPVIIDTPMARLDSSHRKNFVTQYLPEASSQVIVLSTDEEIHGRYLDLIRDNIIDYYTLEYREKEKCTSIIQGYFEEA